MQIKHFVLGGLLATALMATAIAQTPPAAPAQPAPRGGRGGGGQAAVVSPEIESDGRVTFRLRAPSATEVAVGGLPAPLTMAKNAEGVWSATTASALAPDIYNYTFTIDGARVPDPANLLNSWAGTPVGAAGPASTLLITGVPWTNADVPHGAVAKHVYKSPIIGGDETFYVYTPPGYDAKRPQPYPVVVLLHGLGNGAPDWIVQAGANLTLDTLIGEGKAVPMILVTPAAYGNTDGTRGAATGFPNFTKTLIEEIMPQVEKGYNASKSANDHAISGLSMGAAQSLLLLNRLDQFAWIGSFSPGFDMYAPTWGGGGGNGGGRNAAASAAAPNATGQASALGDRGAAPVGGAIRQRPPLEDGNLAAIFPNLDAKANTKIKLLYIAIGTEDDHLMLTRQFKEFLDTRGVKATTYLEVPGFAHVWPFWRLQFAEFAPQLFRTAPK